MLPFLLVMWIMQILRKKLLVKLPALLRVQKILMQ
ncbi:Uncharacterised protein [Mycobacteroides abscessus subsp. massiliense]|nr:Uncharacterised protein [Mycobacteroides abscessus subsp. massiliense]